MEKAKSISTSFGKFGNSLASIGKILLQSKWNIHIPTASKDEEIVVLGNGPSLNDTIQNHSDFLKGRTLLAVNFSANAPVFFDLKPNYYVLADPHFFSGTEHDNVKNLWDNLSKATWKLTIFVPTKAALSTSILSQIKNNTNLSIVRYNLTPIEGFDWLEDLSYSRGLGMPRPRNVLIPSLMLALRMNFKTIYVAGADHSWTKTITVNEQNQVISIQPHFYKEDDKELKRIDTEYMHYPFHQILYSFYVAFKSYFTIQRFAVKQGAKIWNITKGSFIDAFPRKEI